MKAIQYDHHGASDVLQYADVPDPEPGPGDVVVDVAACALNRLDLVQRRGHPHGPLAVHRAVRRDQTVRQGERELGSAGFGDPGQLH